MAAAGAAAPGQGVWGRLSVRRLGPGIGDGSPAGEPAALAADNGAPGPASQTRHGGRLRASEPPAGTTGPGAPELGVWNPRQVPLEAASTEALSPAPPEVGTLPLPDLNDLPADVQPIERLSRLTPLNAVPAVLTPELIAPLPAARARLASPTPAVPGALPRPESVRGSDPASRLRS